MPLSAAAGTAIAGGITAAATLGATAANAGMTKAARKENYMYNEMAAKNAFERQKEFQKYMQSLQYKQFYDLESPKAIMQQLKDAGLSPSLYADSALGANVSGVSNGGGAPQGNGAAGLGAPQIPIGAVDMAQIMLAASQARKNDAEADEIRGNTPQAKANLGKTLKEAGLLDAETDLKKLDASMKGIDLEIAKSTKDMNIRKVSYELHSAQNIADKLYWEASDANLEFMFNLETYNERAKAFTNYNAKTLAEIALTNNQTRLAETQRYKLEAEITKIFEDIWNEGIAAQAAFTNAEAYDEWIQAQIPTLREQLTLRAKELQIANLRLWVDNGVKLLETAGHAMGLIFMGKGKTPLSGVGNPIYTPYNANGASGAGAYNPYRAGTWYGN